MIDTVGSSWVSAVNQVYQTASQTKTQAAEETTAGGAETQDTLTLSEDGQKSLLMSGLFDVEPGKPVTLQDMKAFVDKKLDSFGKGFRALMRSNDIDMSQPITLGHEYGTGRVIVTSDHPQADKIEELLAENPDLSNQYTAATSALTLMKQCKEHSKFAEAYAKDPQAAVAQYSYLFDTRWDISVTFAGDDAQVAYNRVPRQ
jgi:hypothetical protein